jgi:predicted RecB family nuclease
VTFKKVFLFCGASISLEIVYAFLGRDWRDHKARLEEELAKMAGSELLSDGNKEIARQ